MTIFVSVVALDARRQLVSRFLSVSQPSGLVYMCNYLSIPVTGQSVWYPLLSEIEGQVQPLCWRGYPPLYHEVVCQVHPLPCCAAIRSAHLWSHYCLVSYLPLPPGHRPRPETRFPQGECVCVCAGAGVYGVSVCGMWLSLLVLGEVGCFSIVHLYNYSMFRINCLFM